MNVNQSIVKWEPQMVRLTMVPHQDVDGGVETTAYVDPTKIMAVHRTYGGFDSARKMNCTVVMVYGMPGHLLVTETPDTIAMMRDRALGHEPSKPRAIE